MRQYELCFDEKMARVAGVRLGDDMIIPLAMGNRDCVQFLTDWKAGATVTKADGSAVIYSDAAALALGLVVGGG